MKLGCGGGLVVSVLAFYSNKPSLIPALVTYFVRKDKNKRKSGRGWPIFKKSFMKLF